MKTTKTEIIIVIILWCIMTYNYIRKKNDFERYKEQYSITLTATDSLKITNHYISTHEVCIGENYFNDKKQFTVLVTDKLKY